MKTLILTPELTSEIRSHWKILLTVALMGVVLGWASAAARAPKVYAATLVFKSRIVTPPRTYSFVVVPVSTAKIRRTASSR